MGEAIYRELCQAPDVADALRKAAVVQLRDLATWLGQQKRGEIADHVNAALAVEVLRRFRKGDF